MRKRRFLAASQHTLINVLSKMWSRLDTLTDSCFEYLAHLLDEDTEILSHTLRIASGRDYSSLLSVVVSMGKPSLTSALEYSSAHHYWNHPGIALTVREGRFLGLSYYPGGNQSIPCTDWRTVTSPDGGCDFLDLIMIRMPHDTARIEAKIADAVARKQEYHSKQGQNTAQ